jgi:hypothetical protein
MSFYQAHFINMRQEAIFFKAASKLARNVYQWKLQLSGAPLLPLLALLHPPSATRLRKQLLLVRLFP